jgi:dipeptidase
MCDTIALRRGGAVWFAKNSDREPAEAQRVEFIEAVQGDAAQTVRCTYLEIPQASNRRAVILSRPDWMWGAEMGANDAGVVIGNEAVFSNRILKHGESLLGMDLVRLALERAATAEAAARVIADLLERHGQGGPAGYVDKRFRYDNSFLIADPENIIVLETAGRDWVMKRVSNAWSISNSYTIRDDYDRASTGVVGDFKSNYESFVMPRLACAAHRRAATMTAANAASESMSLKTLAMMLRLHGEGDGFDRGSNKDVCMHASGVLRPHASTASMIAKLAPGEPPRLAFTGTIHPCISLFKPASFDTLPAALSSGDLFERGLTAAMRAALDPSFRSSLRRSVEAEEPALLHALEAGRTREAEAIAAKWEARYSLGVASAVR